MGTPSEESNTGERGFTTAAIQRVNVAIVSELARNLIGLFQRSLTGRDIDEVTADDLRAETDQERTDLRLMIWTGVVNEVRSVASGDRVGDDGERINNPIHKSLRENSPLQKGRLAPRDKLDNYAIRQNRHRPDASMVALGPKAIQAKWSDYPRQQSRPWSLYARLQHGTEQTNEWRARRIREQPDIRARRILRLDFITMRSTRSTPSTQGDRPLGRQRLCARPHAGANEYTAADVGLAGENFTGNDVTIGGEVPNCSSSSGVVSQASVGAIDVITVNNEAVDQPGNAAIFSPYGGLTLSRDPMSCPRSLRLDDSGGMTLFVTGVTARRWRTWDA